jgi:hypothetical protein
MQSQTNITFRVDLRLEDVVKAMQQIGLQNSSDDPHACWDPTLRGTRVG